ncbi:MAG TPA: hypothetical protein VIJ07_08550, partial [Dermatophilaceae bacterium]
PENPRPTRAVVLLHRRDRPASRPLRPGEAQRDKLVVGDVSAQLSIEAFDLLDLGQELVNQLRAHHRASSRAALSGCDVPRDGVMLEPGELAGITSDPVKSNASNIFVISSADFTVSLLGVDALQHRSPHFRRGLNRGTRSGRRNRVGQIS